eukprot:TRINITY_DN1919_c0_g1_i2.p1 TRINITY_DN1919_c0_g1~~TRINITY_DN1919_c0_g1_i2.p1  ORF type:complete len:292 (-),score=32.07 TRINITY_DN1919_c0_g1_i2:64-939(-)
MAWCQFITYRSTMPSTVLVASLGIAIYDATTDNGVDDLVFVLSTVPVGMLLLLLVLPIWILIPKLLSRDITRVVRLTITLATTLFMWSVFAVGQILLLSYNVESSEKNEGKILLIGSISLVVYIVIAIIMILLPNMQVGRKGDEDVHRNVNITRFLGGFISIALAISFAEVNDYASGICLSFPSVVLTSLSSLWYVHSETVSTSAIAPMVLGSASNSVYCILFAATIHLFRDNLGIGLGIFSSVVFSEVISLFFSFGFAYLLRIKELKSANRVAPLKIDNERNQFYGSIKM